MAEATDFTELAELIRSWGIELGFQQVGITDTDLSMAERHLDRWLDAGYQGEMGYMSKHGRKRSRPEQLVPGTLSVISVRMDYQLGDDAPLQVLADDSCGYVSRYALGRDYHKLMRKRLQQLAQRVEAHTGTLGYRVFVDSAPVLEKPLAQKAGLGWQGKHSNLVARNAGCWFFLGEIYTDLPLATERAEPDHCGRCNDCIQACPTQAIVAPYTVDARRCISYLTIELEGSIPAELRPAMGNRIYGCDDCLLACPWNRFTRPTGEQAFLPREGLDGAQLVDLFNWSESEFLRRLEGSPIRRIGHIRWLRNIAVALGNASTTSLILQALESQKAHNSDLVTEHVDWALLRHASVPGKAAIVEGSP